MQAPSLFKKILWFPCITTRGTGHLRGLLVPNALIDTFQALAFHFSMLLFADYCNFLFCFVPHAAVLTHHAACCAVQIRSGWSTNN